jgi:hypothetical protein
MCNDIGAMEFDYQEEFVKCGMPFLHNAQKRYAAGHNLSILNHI